MVGVGVYKPGGWETVAENGMEVGVGDKGGHSIIIGQEKTH
jgi:hypothetical protein